MPWLLYGVAYDYQAPRKGETKEKKEVKCGIKTRGYKKTNGGLDRVVF